MKVMKVGKIEKIGGSRFNGIRQSTGHHTVPKLCPDCADSERPLEY